MLLFGALYAAKVYREYQIRVVTCVIRPTQLDAVTAALRRANLMVGLTVLDVRGFGRQRGTLVSEPPQEETFRFLPKLKLEILVKASDLSRTLNLLTTALRTGEIGDGKIVIYNAAAAMRVRTGEKGIWAI